MMIFYRIIAYLSKLVAEAILEHIQKKSEIGRENDFWETPEIHPTRVSDSINTINAINLI